MPRRGVYVIFIVLLLQFSVAFEKNKECGKSVGCFSDSSGNLLFELTWRDTGTQTQFTMKYALPTLQPKGNWIAFALSTDTKMGDDIVFDCITDGTNTFVQRSQNIGYSNSPISTPDPWITASNRSYSNGILMCSFSAADTNTTNIDFKKDWYIFFGKGEYSGSYKSRHDNLPAISANKIDFQTFADLQGEEPSNVLAKLHGIMMISAWILCASIGIVVARYYKPVWLEKKLLGEKVWFTIHRTVMVMAVLFCTAGFILIFVKEEKFSEVSSDSDFKKAHPFIGIIVMCLAIIQPVMALFRPHPGDDHRFIFNWAHWAVGIVLHILAVLNIIIGVLLDDMQMPIWVVYIVIAYAIYQIVIELLLEIYDCIDRVKGKKRSTEYELREKESLTKDQADKSRYNCKKIILGVHIIIIIAFAITLIVLVAVDLSDMK